MDEKHLGKYVDSVIRETKKQYTLKKNRNGNKESCFEKSQIRNFSLMY
ncbi:MAG TPA: hypothetical protein VHJ38_06990 [Nitrososphaeraceae archaeon]|nr:hypothetical protein [Nitrososphaeraceae archaeon]